MRVALLAVIAFLFAPVVMADQPWEPVGPRLTAALDVDAQGHVTHTQLVGNNVLPALQTLAEQVTHGWRFVPATVDGRPVSSRTYAVLAAEGRQVGGSEQLRLRYVSHGPANVLAGAPKYPFEMIREKIEAAVTVVYTIDTDGKVSDVHIVDAKTTDGVKGKLFYHAAINFYKKEKFLPEMVDGHPVVTHVRGPVTFCLIIIADNKKCGTDFARAEDAPHDASGSTQPETTTFADVPIALDSPLKLVSAQP